MITENDFYFVLKDIAVSLREIAHALKSGSMPNGGTAQHDVRKTIADFNADAKKSSEEAERAENEEISAIMEEKPSEAEMGQYMSKRFRNGKGRWKKPSKGKRTQKPSEEAPQQPSAVQTEGKEPHKVASVNPDSDFE